MDKNEIRVLTSYVKGMFSDNKEPEKKVIIALCNELERITDLKPVGYIMESSFDNIKEYGYTYLNEERTEKINIPLYKLD